MRRYLLFAGDMYYPAGGWDDFIADFDIMNEAIKTGIALKDDSRCDWWKVIDTTTKKEVAI